MFDTFQRIDESQAIRQISHINWCILTPIGCRALLDAIEPPEIRVVLETVLATGARLSEVLKLGVPDVNFSARLLHLSNSNRPYMPLHVHLVNHLESYHREYHALGSNIKFFVDTKGRPLTVARVSRALHKAGKQLHWRHRMTPSLLRQTFAMHALHYGVADPIFMKLLGYSHVSHELVFTDIRTQMKQTIPTLELIYETLIMCTDRLNIYDNQTLECTVELGEQNGHKYIGLVRTEAHSAYWDAEDDGNNGDQIMSGPIQEVTKCISSRPFHYLNRV